MSLANLTAEIAHATWFIHNSPATRKLNCRTADNRIQLHPLIEDTRGIPMLTVQCVLYHLVHSRIRTS